MRPHVLLCIPLAAGFLFAQASIEGRVVNAVTGEPMGDVDLTLRALPPGTDGQKVTSDAEGRFSYEDVAPGSYTLSADRLRQMYGSRPGGTPLKLPAGEALKDIEFRLVPPGVLSGIVVDGQGRPVRGASVVATAATGGSTRTTTSSDAAGKFRFPGLTPGTYLLVATPPALAMRAGKGEQPVATYYPSALDEIDTIPLRVVPGQDLPDLRITIRTSLLYHVQGTVVRASPDVSLADVMLLLTQRGPAGSQRRAGVPSGSRSPAEDGSFDLGGVAPGSYELRATLKGEGRVVILSSRGGLDPEVVGVVTLGRTPVDVIDSDVAGLVLRIGKPLQVSGTMRMEGQDEADFKDTRILLRPMDFTAGNLASTTVRTGNAFALEEVPPDKHAVLVTGLPAHAYVKGIRLGGQDALASGLDLTNMETAPLLEILIRPNGATVEGAVKGGDDEPAAGVRVSLVPDPARPELALRLKSTTTAGDGRFSLTGVAPGEYRLYSYPQPRLAVLIDMEFFKPFESKAVKVSIREGENKQADLTLLNAPETR